jgi:hypothetical protein
MNCKEIEMTMNEERVARGVKLLDIVNPGWHEKINIEELYLRQCWKCVLGQLYGTYSEGILLLPMEMEDAYKFGFNIFNTNDTPLEIHFSYQELEEEWKKQIRAKVENEVDEPVLVEKKQIRAKVENEVDEPVLVEV